jgi:hypothetical protein
MAYGVFSLSLEVCSGVVHRDVSCCSTNMFLFTRGTREQKGRKYSLDLQVLWLGYGNHCGSLVMKEPEIAPLRRGGAWSTGKEHVAWSSLRRLALCALRYAFNPL